MGATEGAGFFLAAAAHPERRQRADCAMPSPHPFYANGGRGWGYTGAVLGDGIVRGPVDASAKHVQEWTPQTAAAVKKSIPVEIAAAQKEREMLEKYASRLARWAATGTPGSAWPTRCGTRLPSPIGFVEDNKKMQFFAAAAESHRQSMIRRQRRKRISLAVAGTLAVAIPAASYHLTKAVLATRTSDISREPVGWQWCALLATLTGIINVLPYIIFVCFWVDSEGAAPRQHRPCWLVRHCCGCCHLQQRCGCIPRCLVRTSGLKLKPNTPNNKNRRPFGVSSTVDVLTNGPQVEA